MANMFHKKKESFKLGLDKDSMNPVPIEKSNRGKNCNVICADCKQDFIAAKGEKNEWHYRHSVESDCKGGQESALHKLAKEIICRNSEMIVPKNARINYTNPISEINQDEFRPDITAKYGDENLYFEVVVKNPVSPKKANHYISNQIKSIILDLGKYEFLSETQLEKYIIENIKSKKVLFWTKKESASLGQILTLLGFLGLMIYLYFKYGDKDKNEKPLSNKNYKAKLGKGKKY